MFVPKLAKNCSSVLAIAQMGDEVRFYKEKCTVFKDAKKILIGHVLDGKLYKVNALEFAQFNSIKFTIDESME